MLEYAAVVWSTHHYNDITKLERIQNGNKNGAKYVGADIWLQTEWNKSTNDLSNCNITVKKLSWTPLGARNQTGAPLFKRRVANRLHWNGIKVHPQPRQLLLSLHAAFATTEHEGIAEPAHTWVRAEMCLLNSSRHFTVFWSLEQLQYIAKNLTQVWVDSPFPSCSLWWAKAACNGSSSCLSHGWTFRPLPCRQFATRLSNRGVPVWFLAPSGVHERNLPMLEENDETRSHYINLSMKETNWIELIWL